jgi:hypothetical protein
MCLGGWLIPIDGCFGKAGKHFITLWVQSNQKPRAQQKSILKLKTKITAPKNDKRPSLLFFKETRVSFGLIRLFLP